MRISFYCLLIALAMRLAFDQVTAQDKPKADKHAYLTDGKTAVEWHFHDEYRVWLSVNTYNTTETWSKEGYHPSYTYIRSQYQPIVKKLPDGQWIITFTSEIATDIP